MTPERGFAARWLRLFPFPLKIHFKGRQLPAGRGFFKISFALVIRATGFWQPAGQRIFPFTPHTTALRNLPNGAGSFFWLHLPTTGDFRFCQMDNKKSSKSFSRLTVSCVAVGRRVFCFEHCEGRAALLAVRPLITCQQRRARLSTAGAARSS